MPSTAVSAAPSKVARHFVRGFAALVLLLVCLCLPSRVAHAETGGTQVGAIVCGESSELTITEPAEASTSTSSLVLVNGSVAQANQVEVQVDGAYHSTTQLSLGQTLFTVAVQLIPGPHTITIKAINACPGPSQSVERTITYTPPTSTPNQNVGATTPPPRHDSQSGSATTSLLAANDLADDSGKAAEVPSAHPLTITLGWLGLVPASSETESSDVPKVFTPLRATIFTAGALLTFFGLPRRIEEHIVGRFFRWSPRLIGAGIALGCMLL